uniref:Uncharacterized protein n=1 Tax=Arundo donax TaxID=35708 RepID=A0A0A9E3X2_ARUDO
MPGHSCGD